MAVCAGAWQQRKRGASIRTAYRQDAVLVVQQLVAHVEHDQVNELTCRGLGDSANPVEIRGVSLEERNEHGGATPYFVRLELRFVEKTVVVKSQVVLDLIAQREPMLAALVERGSIQLDEWQRQL